MPLPSLKGIGIGKFSIPFSNQPLTSLPSTQLPQESVPFSQETETKPSINPVTLATDVIHGIARSGAAVGLTFANQPEIPQYPEGTLERNIQTALFGPETVKSLATRIAEGEQTAHKLGFGKFSLPISFGVVGGIVGLDFSGVGGIENAGERLLKETSPEIISKILTKIGVSENLVPKYAELFSKAKTPEEVSGGLESLLRETKTVSELGEVASERPGQLPEAIGKQATGQPRPLAQQQHKPLLNQPFSPPNPETQEILRNKRPLETSIPSPSEKSIGQETEDVANWLVNTIRASARPERTALEKLYTAERSRRATELEKVFAEGAGQPGYFEALGKLKGELAPIEKKVFDIGEVAEDQIKKSFRVVQLSPTMDVFDKLNAQTALTKLFHGIIPTNSELSLLENVFGKEVVTTVLEQRTNWQKFTSGLAQAFNLPRSIMASFDLSAPFRQGLFLISHPTAFLRSFKGMFGQFASEEAFKAVQQGIRQMPEYSLMKEGKLALTDLDAFINTREERIASQWGEKIPLGGRIVRASNRAYTGFLNKLRADVFSEIVRGARASGREVDSKLARQIARFVNIASGRGEFAKISAALPFLNGLLFSPRLALSRVQILNPYNYIFTDPVVRKEFLKSLLSVAGTGITILSLAKMMGAKVGGEPRSSDFGKIISGKTRVDIWGGLQQYVRMAAQLITGEYISSTTGKQYTLGEGYKPVTRLDIVARQIESKESPILSFITNVLRQQDYVGKKIKITNEIVQRFVPIIVSDLYDLAKTNPDLLPLGIFGLFGGGLQTYTNKRYPPSGPSSNELPSLKGIGI